MLELEYQKAREFIGEIKEEDSILILCHNDLDGIASGILFFDFCKGRGCKQIKIVPISYGISNISDLHVERFNKILVADLAPEQIIKDFEKFPEDTSILYTDHHPKESKNSIRKNIIELRTTEQGYIPSSRTVYELCGGKKWLAVVGVLSDFGDKEELNREFIESFIEESGKSIDYLKQEIMYKVSRAIIYSEKHPEINIIEKLGNIVFLEDIKNLDEYAEPVKKEFDKFIELFNSAEQINDLVVYYYFEPEYNIKSFIINFISSRNPSKVYIFATPKNKEIIGLSARNQSNEYDVSQILKDCIIGLKDSSAGGHVSAAGAQINLFELDKFIEQLKKYDPIKSKI